MSDEYNDIINYEYKGSKRENKMSLYDRSAQFKPFAALVGYDEAIFEKGRITNKKIELSDEMINNINKKLLIVSNNLDNDYLITYFVKDQNKDGGMYYNINTKIKKIDLNKHLIVTDNMNISFDDIYDISSNIFEKYGII